MSTTDRESIVELLRTVEEHSSAQRQQKEADAAAEVAESQQQDAHSSLASAQAASKSTEEAATRAAGAVSLANETLLAAKSSLELASAGLVLRRARAEDAKHSLRDKEAMLVTATTGRGAADKRVAESKSTSDAASTSLASKRASVEVAASRLATAESALLKATEIASKDLLSRLQRHCGATDAEFAAYVRDRDLLSLVRAAVAGAARTVMAATVRQVEATANLSTAKVTFDAAQQAVAQALKLHESSMREAFFSDAEASMRDREHVTAIEQVATSREGVIAADNHTAGILKVREQVEGDAMASIAAHAPAVKALAESKQKRDKAAADFQAAQNTTRRREGEVATAEEKEAEAARAVREATTWLAGFNASLEIDHKALVLDRARHLEEKRSNKEKATAQYERRQQAGLNTHKKHLALCNAAVELDDKEAFRVKSKTEYQEAEKAVLAAQTKLDTLVENEKKTQKEIHETYKELQKLLEVYHKAKAVHDAQDPKDRERSFVTYLGGAAPDPNGIDVR